MIEIKSIKKKYVKNNSLAIDDISFNINNGEIISIVGPSGCGKTTLLRIIAGLVKPTEGSVNFKSDVKNNSNKKSSIVFQNPVLLPWRNVYDNVKLPNELNNIVGNKRVIEKIKLVGLEEFRNHFPNELSGGMQQRVNVARALVLNPELILMDEPFGALDEINRNKLNLELLRIHQKLKPTIVFVTHAISEAVFISNKVVILSDRPSKIKDIIPIYLPKERNIELKDTKEFQEYVKCILKKI